MESEWRWNVLNEGWTDDRFHLIAYAKSNNPPRPFFYAHDRFDGTWKLYLAAVSPDGVMSYTVQSAALDPSFVYRVCLPDHPP